MLVSYQSSVYSLHGWPFISARFLSLPKTNVWSNVCTVCLIQCLILRKKILETLIQHFGKCFWKLWSSINGWWPCLWQGGWSLMILEVPSNPSHSMILWNMRVKWNYLVYSLFVHTWNIFFIFMSHSTREKNMWKQEKQLKKKKSWKRKQFREKR